MPTRARLKKTRLATVETSSFICWFTTTASVEELLRYCDNCNRLYLEHWEFHDWQRLAGLSGLSDRAETMYSGIFLKSAIYCKGKPSSCVFSISHLTLWYVLLRLWTLFSWSVTARCLYLNYLWNNSVLLENLKLHILAVEKTFRCDCTAT